MDNTTLTPRPHWLSDGDPAAQGFHGRVEHVQADPTAREIGDGVRRGESGLKDHLPQHGVFGFFPGADQSPLAGPGKDAVAVKATAVVGHRDLDVAADLRGAKGDAAPDGLAGRLALSAGLQPVIGGVADHMNKRLVQAVHQGLVDFGVLAFQHEVDFLAGLALQFPHHAAHTAKHLANRNKPQFGGGVLNLADDELQTVGRFFEFGQVETREVRTADRFGDAEA